MNVKQFLKPDQGKIVILVIITIVLSLLPFKFGSVYYNAHGLPLPLYFCMPNGLYVYPEAPAPNCGFVDYPYLYLYSLIDIVFWYLISCFIIWIYDKLKKKPQ